MMIVTKLTLIFIVINNTMMATTTPYAMYTANNSVKVSLVDFSFIKIF